MLYILDAVVKHLGDLAAAAERIAAAAERTAAVLDDVHVGHRLNVRAVEVRRDAG
jgi:hypothetical protein